MNESIINKQYKEIINLLDKRSFREALQAIELLIFDTQDWELRSSFEEIYTSYQYMLQYMRQGSIDPDRDKLYNKLLSTAYQIADKARILKLTPSSTEFYFDRIRYYKLIPLRSLPELQLELETYTEDIAVEHLLTNDANQEMKLDSIRRRHEQAYSELFYRTWLSDKWTETDEEEARNFLTSLLVQINDLSLFISAITLSLMEYFDIRKFMLLFDAYQHSSNEVNQRALVGIALIVFMYDERLSIYPEVAARINLLNEDTNFSNEMNRIQIQLLRSRETKKIDKKMREEIIPEMMRNVNISRKLDIDDNDEENASDDQNPDWEDWMERSGMNDKLKEMSELQMEGADVYMSTFAQLKTYPFFHDMANWFYPFDAQHSSVVRAFSTTANKRNILLDSILQSGFFCNSDKYSFCLTITQIPPNQREMMTQQFEAQNEALSEAKHYEKMLAYSQRTETISNQYIQDLYRFFKIYPRRHEFRDLFEESLNLQYCKTLKDTFNNVEHMFTLAGYFFAKDYLLEALMLYQDIIKETEGNAEIYQKIGYCFQKNKNYSKAIEAYLQADLLKPDNVWTNRHLAISYRQSGQYDKALEYYKKVEAAQSENLTVILQIGLCLAELKQYDEALAYFFKLEYLDNESIKSQRAIAWCSFVTRKFEQAMKYYSKILEKKPQMQDYLNAGHVAWITGNINTAVQRYAIALTLSDKTVFINQFDKDKEILLKLGINKNDFQLMIDLIKYSADSLE